ncbi:hypothetical protein Q9R08_04900 [Microbacterium sp. QXD-8]|uniref:Uncharacterized protein n=1 Tax=Microbacterium psychrotolerans TaxID=3068321 RepID=A0ABU0YYA6_9MICO|nr:hypothetical protein [Microbacterium sp. QXD-8]MDQ7877310.1 hypothetical protein [Microbacterium sp. QXD-8]
MWLFIAGQSDPPKIEKAVGNKTEAFDGYWYNLDTGAVIFLTRDDDVFRSANADKIRVWAIAAAEQEHAVDVTYALTKQEWKYTDSKMSNTTFMAVYKAVYEKLNELLGVR